MLFLELFFIVALAELTCGQTVTPYTAQQIESMLGAHNGIRSIEAAGDMQRMIWDPALQQMAEGKAMTCDTTPTPTANLQNQNGFPTVGENIGSGTGAVPATVVEPLGVWATQKPLYTYGTVGGTAKCSAPNGCNEFTQMVWSTSCSVGCGTAACTNLKQGGTAAGAGWMTVCMYGPGGNTNGVAPYMSSAVRCSGCIATCQLGVFCQTTCTPMTTTTSTTTASTTTTTTTASPTTVSTATTVAAPSVTPAPGTPGGAPAPAVPGVTPAPGSVTAPGAPGPAGPSIPAPPCADYRNYCPYWSSLGQCAGNRPYMYVVCAKSCGYCAGTAGTVPADIGQYYALLPAIATPAPVVVPSFPSYPSSSHVMVMPPRPTPAYNHHPQQMTYQKYVNGRFL